MNLLVQTLTRKFGYIKSSRTSHLVSFRLIYCNKLSLTTDASHSNNNCVLISMLTSDSIAQGRIFWLKDPFKDEDSEDSDYEPPGPQDTYGGVEIGLLGHPVMVLHALEGATDVAVCVVSFLPLSPRICL